MSKFAPSVLFSVASNKGVPVINFIRHALRNEYNQNHIARILNDDFKQNPRNKNVSVIFELNKSLQMVLNEDRDMSEYLNNLKSCIDKHSKDIQTNELTKSLNQHCLKELNGFFYKVLWEGKHNQPYTLIFTKPSFHKSYVEYVKRVFIRKSETEPESKLQSKSNVRHEPIPVFKSRPKCESEFESRPKCESESKPQSESKCESESGFKCESKPETEITVNSTLTNLINEIYVKDRIEDETFRKIMESLMTTHKGAQFSVYSV